jgi:predicted CoA-binding protein
MTTPGSVARFLAGKRIAVAGASRDNAHVGNVVLRKLRDSGYVVVPINPNASELEGMRCYPDLASIDGNIDGLFIATPPSAAAGLVRQCIDHGVRRVWLHRSIGRGSVSSDAIRECEANGIECIAGGCPMMYCEPVDIAHRCMRWFLRLGKR